MNSDFKDLLSLLDLHQVKYLVAGGYAVMLYSEPRYTKDIDIFVGVRDGNVDRVARALADFGFPMSEDAQAELTLLNPVISIGRAPSRIDYPERIDMGSNLSRHGLSATRSESATLASRSSRSTT